MGCGGSKEGAVKANAPMARQAEAAAAESEQKLTVSPASVEGERDPEAATPETVGSPTDVVEGDANKAADEPAAAVDEKNDTTQFPEDPLHGREFIIGDEAKEVELQKGVKYKGDWLNGRQHGIGQTKFPDGGSYIGEYIEGKPHGLGIYTAKDGSEYRGEFQESKANGYGVYTFNDGTKYYGPFVDDKRQGVGKEVQPDGMIYIGEFSKGRKHGTGKMWAANGEVYDGEFNNGEIAGRGVYKWPDGRVYDGEWDHSLQHGQAVFVWPDGRKYTGSYEKGKLHGNGVLEWPDGRKYDGEFKNNFENGKGKYYSKRGEYREALWLDGVRVKWLGEPIVETPQDETLPEAKPDTPADNPTSGGMTDFLGGKANDGGLQNPN